jgi:hypothetical protein
MNRDRSAVLLIAGVFFGLNGLIGLFSVGGLLFGWRFGIHIPGLMGPSPSIALTLLAAAMFLLYSAAGICLVLGRMQALRFILGAFGLTLLFFFLIFILPMFLDIWQAALEGTLGLDDGVASAFLVAALVINFLIAKVLFSYLKSHLENEKIR